MDLVVQSQVVLKISLEKQLNVSEGQQGIQISVQDLLKQPMSTKKGKSI